MNDRIRRRYEMVNRVSGFGKTYASHFAAGSRGAELFAIVDTTLARVEDQAAVQEANRTATKQGTLSKGLLRDRLLEEMEAINLTARAMVGKVAGLEEKFRMPHNAGDQDLLTVARVFARDAQPFKDEFIRRALPATFIEDLNALIDEFADALADREQSAGARVAATVARDEAMEHAIDAVRELNAVVRNSLRGDRAALAEWQSASHIERAPQHQKEKPTPPPTGGEPPASNS
ncbi:MAG TPA: hypothetical protein VJZ91_04180 [Blastocatellia bacterium]|nr:hypothetical protein [Blastocatellia bacterium]